jgi:hypothetical protein
MNNKDTYSVDSYIESLIQEEKEILLLLQDLILEVIPHAKIKLSYGVPYFFLNRRSVFLWPVSKEWSGYRHSKDFTHGVQLGFCYGYLMDVWESRDKSKNRKQIYTRIYTSLNQFTENEISEIKSMLINALEIDTNHKKR